MLCDQNGCLFGTKGSQLVCVHGLATSLSDAIAEFVDTGLVPCLAILPKGVLVLIARYALQHSPW